MSEEKEGGITASRLKDYLDRMTRSIRKQQEEEFERSELFQGLNDKQKTFLMGIGYDPSQTMIVGHDTFCKIMERLNELREEDV